MNCIWALIVLNLEGSSMGWLGTAKAHPLEIKPLGSGPEHPARCSQNQVVHPGPTSSLLPSTPLQTWGKCCKCAVPKTSTGCAR